MTIRMRLLLWFLPMLVASVAIIMTFVYINDIYEIIIPKNAFSVIVVSLVILTFLVIAAVFIMAHKISRPIQSLNQAALEIASGDYGQTIYVEGPREIQQLAQTLNTMSSCLEEQIHRLRESSLARERLYGEYECSLLLQHYMLQKVVDTFISSELTARLIKVTSATVSQGYFLKMVPNGKGCQFHIAEAKEKGFHGMYDLLQNQHQFEAHGYPTTIATLKNSTFSCSTHHMSPPIVWSTRRHALTLIDDKEIKIESGDFIFFYNKGFAKQFHQHQLIQSWFGKVLRHFAKQSFDSFTMILNNELNFLANKQHIPDDMYILCLRSNYES